MLRKANLFFIDILMCSNNTGLYFYVLDNHNHDSTLQSIFCRIGQMLQVCGWLLETMLFYDVFITYCRSLLTVFSVVHSLSFLSFLSVCCLLGRTNVFISFSPSLSLIFMSNINDAAIAAICVAIYTT